MTQPRGRREQYQCRCCGAPFTARVSDRARGWARFCGQSCASRYAGQYRELMGTSNLMRSCK